MTEKKKKNPTAVAQVFVEVLVKNPVSPPTVTYSQAEAVAQIRSLAWEIPNVSSLAEKKKKNPKGTQNKQTAQNLPELKN